MEKNRYPCVLLRHIETGKYHPVPFRRCMLPGMADINSDMGRYKSIGHLPEGLETIEAAIEYMKNFEKADMDFSTGEIFDWDGTTESAVMVKFFKTSTNDGCYK